VCKFIPEGLSPLCVELAFQSISKSQARFPWGIEWRKRDYKSWYWRTGTE